jgi:hypothetical protein
MKRKVGRSLSKYFRVTRKFKGFELEELGGDTKLFGCLTASSFFGFSGFWRALIFRLLHKQFGQLSFNSCRLVLMDNFLFGSFICERNCRNYLLGSFTLPSVSYCNLKFCHDESVHKLFILGTSQGSFGGFCNWHNNIKF